MRIPSQYPKRDLPDARLPILLDGTRLDHSLAAGKTARAVAAAHAFDAGDAELLVSAALLHDIGYAADLAVTGFHPLDGAVWLAGRGEQRLAALVAHHTSADEEAELRGLTAELSRFPADTTCLRDALDFCDLHTAPDGSPTTFAARVAGIRSRYPSGDPVHEAIDSAEPRLSGAVSRIRKAGALGAPSGS